MKVFTYHEDLPGYPDCKELLSLWAESWRRHGWEPEILTHDHAKAHPMYEFMMPAALKLPTTNPQEYELTVYRRWLAMGSVGGGLMVDNDVINYGYRPRDLVCACCPPAFPSRPIAICPHKVPCAVFASPAHCEEFAHAFIQTAAHCEKIIHTGDMQILCKLDMETRPVVVSVYKPGWKEAYLVHYAWRAIFDVTQTRPVLKAEIIKKEKPI